MHRPTDDPRSSLEFHPAAFPRCDGADLSATVSHARDRARLQLAVAYYHLNLAHSALQRYREGPRGRRGSEEERHLLQQIELALVRKEGVEDELARMGMCATPTLAAGLVVDLEFCEPARRGAAKVLTHHSSSLSVDFGIEFPWEKGVREP